MAEKQTDRRTLIGVAFLLIGAVLVLNNFYILPFYIPSFIFSWPSILIVIGLALIIGKGNNSGGFVTLTIGVVFLLMHGGYLSWRDIGGFWPLVFVLIGLSLLLKSSDRKRDRLSGEKKNSTDFIDEVTIFGGTKKMINSPEFQGGKTTTMFGGTEIVLQNASPAPEGAIMETFTMFGGTEFIVPSDWDVQVEATAILGGIDDKRSVVGTAPDGEPKKLLIIRGFVMFGAVDIKSYA